jgi:hypothetical protein
MTTDSPREPIHDLYPWRTMAIGESFILRTKYMTNAQTTCQNAMHRTGREFHINQTGLGFQVTRTA